MKIKFNSNNNLPLNEILKIYNLTVLVRSVFQEDNKYYSQMFQMNYSMKYKCQNRNYER